MPMSKLNDPSYSFVTFADYINNQKSWHTLMGLSDDEQSKQCPGLLNRTLYSIANIEYTECVRSNR